MKRGLALFLLFIVAVGLLQYVYDSHIGYFSRRQVFVTMPVGKTLEILSFGFQNLVADFLYIWAIQFYSNYHYSNRFEFLENIFNAITDLNPTYFEPYVIGSWIMALEAEDHRMAIRLLQKGSKNMKDEWFFDHESGFYAYKDLKDYKMAEIYFRRASEKPGAPTFLKRRRSHMIYMLDDLEQAYQLWDEHLKSSKNYLEKNAARNHLYQIKYEIDKKNLEIKIEHFKKQFGRYPYTLSEMKRVAFISKIPTDYIGEDYVYSRKTGKIVAKKTFRWKKFL
jgi:hypothetical protein